MMKRRKKVVMKVVMGLLRVILRYPVRKRYMTWLISIRVP